MPAHSRQAQKSVQAVQVPCRWGPVWCRSYTRAREHAATLWSAVTKLLHLIGIRTLVRVISVGEALMGVSSFTKPRSSGLFFTFACGARGGASTGVDRVAVIFDSTNIAVQSYCISPACLSRLLADEFPFFEFCSSDGAMKPLRAPAIQKNRSRNKHRSLGVEVLRNGAGCPHCTFYLT
jgi:hypothetical protein